MRAAGLNGVPDENKQAELTRIRTLREIVAAVCRGLDAAPATAVVPAQAGPVHDTVSAPASTTPDAATVATALVELIGERTGYPVAMLDADLDLEADLSIGSLKRTEIIGLLADRLAPAYRLDEPLQAELTRLRTVRLITERIAGAGPAAAPSVPAPTAAPQVEIGPVAAPAPAPARTDRPAVHRYLLEPAPIEVAVATADLTGRHVTVVSGSPGVVIELCAALEEQGATVRTVSTDPSEELGDVDILVHLAASGPSEPPSLPEAFAALRRAVLGGARQLLVATGHGGRFGHRTVIDNGVRTDLPAGLGLAGLVRTIAREYPEISCRLVDLDPKDLPGLLAGHLVTELRTAAGPELIGYTTEGRCTLSLVPAPLAAAGTAVRASDLGLSERSVVLLTGGARGITSRIAREIAETANCHIVLWGRTPLPVDEEAAATAGATDPAALRRALIEAGEKVPARVEAEVRRILAEREVRASLTGLRAHAASVDYTCVDVRDPVAVADAVAELMVRHGRVDGVVHGAGVLDDRLIADKTTDGFARVWETKVDGARALAAALSPDLRFLVLFGSVSGVFGNRGQCDYAAANDALDTLARSWEGRFTGRVLSVDWGPWAPADGAGDGMVSEELLRAYARQGVSALHPDDGVRAFLEELAHGSEPQVVYVCAEPSAFDAAFSDGRPAGAG
jgi:NAD(P)-dependent dehydrogenase (short-subunit alcohol dehydrogenase family)